MKNLQEQLIRISEIMGLPENAHFIREEKELLNEQLSFIRKLFGQDFSDLPPTWRVNRQGSRIRSIDIPDDQGRFVGRIEAEPKHWTELENALSNQTVRLKDLSVGARKLLWKLYKQAPPNQTTGTAISKADELYKDLMQELSGGVKGVTELNFLRNISDDISPSTTGVRMTLKDALMKRLGNDEELVEILIPLIDKRLKYYQKKVLVNVGEDVIGQLTHPESVKAFRAKKALEGAQLTAFENKLKNPKKIKDDLIDIQQAQGDLFDALKYVQTGKNITPELEDFILRRMNVIYERQKSLIREVEDFVSGLRKSGDEDFERIADLMDDIKTKNGGEWERLLLLPHQDPEWLKILFAIREGFKAGRSIDFLKGFRFLGRKMEGLYNKSKNLIKREKVDEINNSVNNEISKEIGPNWLNAVIGGSSRGMPWFKGPSTKSSLRNVVDHYKPLRNLTDAQTKNYYPGLSYAVELLTRSLKYSLYYTLIKATGTGVDIIFKRLNKDEADCFNEILKFFREKGITDEEEILKYLTGVGTLTDEDEEILKNEKIETESGGVTRKILEKNVPCVQVMLPLNDKQKLRKWYKLLDLYLSGDSDAVYGDRTPFGAELFENFKQSLGRFGWDSPWGAVGNAALAFTTVDDWIRMVEEGLNLASTPQEIRELTDLERAAMEQGLFGNEKAFEAYCTKEGLKYVGWTTIGRVGRGCASISQERPDEYVQYEYKAELGWKSTGDSCDENFGPRMKDVTNKTDTLSKSSVTPDSLPQSTTPQPPIPNVPKKMTPEEKKRILDSLRQGGLFNED